ncbi:hypothetical protein, partial [Legionella pneumophila]|uniref:hypothetical protein n=1 Tax=Legionella pneumophila TaxID=446 RepID=UPI001E55CD7A
MIFSFNAGIFRFYGYFSFFTLYLLWALVIFVKTGQYYLLIEIKNGFLSVLQKWQKSKLVSN